MGVGKYSPTVSVSYQKDQEWFEKNGGGFGNGINKDSCYDNDGFDSYGYNEDGFDRAGIHENAYMQTYTVIEDEFYYTLYEEISDDWNFSIVDKKQNHNTLMLSNEKYSTNFKMLQEIDDIITKAKAIRAECQSNIAIEYEKLMMELNNVKK